MCKDAQRKCKAKISKFCHGPVIACDKCRSCYNRAYYLARHRYLGPEYEGLVHVPVKGWGTAA